MSPWWKRPAVLWVAGSLVAVVLAAVAVILVPGVQRRPFNQLLLLPLAGLLIYGGYRVLPARVQWGVAWLVLPVGPVAYLAWPNDQWWTYGSFTALPLVALWALRDDRRHDVT